MNYSIVKLVFQGIFGHNRGETAADTDNLESVAKLMIEKKLKFCSLCFKIALRFSIDLKKIITNIFLKYFLDFYEIIQFQMGAIEGFHARTRR